MNKIYQSIEGRIRDLEFGLKVAKCRLEKDPFDPEWWLINREIEAEYKHLKEEQENEETV